MESDANIINQAGKLRMISYNMAQLSNQMVLEKYSNEFDQLTSNLENRMSEYESTLVFLGEESDKSILFNHSHSDIKLELITREWFEVFKPEYINVLSGKSNHESCVIINREIDSYVNDINEMVTTFSVNAKAKISWALILNGGLVFVIIIVTLFSFITTYNRIRKPIKILMQELKALSLIDIEVSKKIKNIKTDEITEMAGYFNEMLYDQLTKTFNRRAGISKLSRMLQYDNRRHLKLSLCFIDINGLKEVNDQLGHLCGDELIISAVDGIKQEIRDDDFIIRMGGDEFLVVFIGIDQEVAENVWTRISHKYDWINEQEDRKYIISVSHGIVDVESLEISEVESLIKTADDKMYAEKKYIKEELKVQIIKSAKN